MGVSSLNIAAQKHLNLRGGNCLFDVCVVIICIDSEAKGVGVPVGGGGCVHTQAQRTRAQPTSNGNEQGTHSAHREQHRKNETQQAMSVNPVAIQQYRNTTGKIHFAHPVSVVNG